jgi:hypothetical protein
MDATAFREYAGALSTLVIDARFVLLALILSIVATLVVVRNVLPRLIGLVVRPATTRARGEDEREHVGVVFPGKAESFGEVCESDGVIRLTDEPLPD